LDKYRVIGNVAAFTNFRATSQSDEALIVD